MGLLTDTFDLYKKQLEKLQGIDNTGDDFSGMDSDFNRSRAGIEASLKDRKDGSPLTKPGGNLFPTSIVPQNQGQIKTPIGNINLPKSVLTKEAAANQDKANKIPAQDASKIYPDQIMKTGTGTKYATDGNWFGSRFPLEKLGDNDWHKFVKNVCGYTGWIQEYFDT